MSKINEYSQRAEEVKQEYMWKFMEHLYEMIPEPVLMESDVIEMESNLYKPLPLSNEIIPKHSLNNTNYQPRQGA